MPAALLDYDGYICKSFYANKEDMMDFTKAEEILNDLKYSAWKKAANYFNCDMSDVMLYPIISGHSWKKDIYPSYKRTRKRDEYLGMYRQIISERKEVIKVEPLEADELLIILNDYIKDFEDGKCIVFSDDKDLRYYADTYCKINITEQVVSQDPQALIYNQLAQMLIGDKEDNINGVPKVGEKTAHKILSQCGYTLKNVIRIFKEKEVDIDMTLRDLLLVVPLSETYLNDVDAAYKVANSILNGMKPNDLDVHNAIIGQIEYIRDNVMEVYNDKN